MDESGEQLKDYKIHCFNGEPKIIQVDFDRFTNHKRNLYDSNWNYIPESYQYPSDPNKNFPRPKMLDEMLYLANKLSEGYPYLRVDFYIVYNKIYFGEITLYPEAGFGKFSSESFGRKMGDWIKLPK